MVFGETFTELVCSLVQHLEYVACRNPYNGIVNMYVNPTKEGLVFANTMGSTGYCAVIENLHSKQLIVCFKPRDFPELFKKLSLLSVDDVSKIYLS